MNQISKERIEGLKESFQRHKEQGGNYVKLVNAIVIFQELGFLINDKMKLEIFNLVEKSTIDFNNFVQILVFLLKVNSS